MVECQYGGMTTLCHSFLFLDKLLNFIYPHKQLIATAINKNLYKIIQNQFCQPIPPNLYLVDKWDKQRGVDGGDDNGVGRRWKRNHLSEGTL